MEQPTTRLAADTFKATLVRTPAPVRSAVLIASLIFTGVFAATQIGKAVICMPLIREEMQIGLGVAGLIVAVFAALGALGGFGAGAAVARIGLHRSLIGGLVAIAAANLLGCYAPNAGTLLMTRILEGIGFFGVILSAPSLLAGLLNGAKRNFVMAVWSAYLPTGIMLMLLFAPALPNIGWRHLWLAHGVLAAALAIFWHAMMGAVSTSQTASKNRHPGVSFKHAIDVLRDKRCLAAAFCLFAFSSQIFSMSFALPHLLTSAYAFSIGDAGLLSSFVLAVSVAGHIASGYLLRAELSICACVAISLLTISVLSIFIYGADLPASATVICAAVALGVGGLAPGALYASAPHISPAAGNVPTTIGLLQQGSNMGQFAGPMMVGTLASHFGWPSAVFAVVPLALAGSLACLLLRGAERE